jgi:hypothetical protein
MLGASARLELPLFQRSLPFSLLLPYIVLNNQVAPRVLLFIELQFLSSSLSPRPPIFSSQFSSPTLPHLLVSPLPSSRPCALPKTMHFQRIHPGLQRRLMARGRIQLDIPSSPSVQPEDCSGMNAAMAECAPQPWPFKCPLTYVFENGKQVAKGDVDLVIKCIKLEVDKSPALVSPLSPGTPAKEYTLVVYSAESANAKVR